ncbi:MAG: DUF2911 domain-containing protein [Flavisolibacter sp.]
MPQPSPGETIKQDFGTSSVELVYSRPSIRGRKIFGDLVPYGKVWRTGANAATYIKFNDDVIMGGQALKAGEYAIYTVPSVDQWEVIINKGINKSGTEYKQEEDLVRFKVKPMPIDHPVETFTMQFGNIKPTSMDLRIMWDKTAVSIPITTDIDKKIMAQIDNAMNKDNRPYFQAGMYYMESGKDLNQSITWFNKALEQNPNAYWVLYQKATALAKLGKKEEARAAAQKSMDMARQGKNEDYVRLNENFIKTLK